MVFALQPRRFKLTLSLAKQGRPGGEECSALSGTAAGTGLIGFWPPVANPAGLPFKYLLVPEDTAD